MEKKSSTEIGRLLLPGVVFLSLFFSSLSGQLSTTDSLLSLAESLPYKHRDSAQTLIRQALEQVQINGTPEQIAFSYTRAGKISGYKGRFQAANDYFFQARESYLGVGALHQAAQAYESQAEIQQKLGNEDRSLILLSEAQTLYDAIGDDRDLCGVLVQKGDAQRRLGHKPEALATWSRSLELCPDSLLPALVMEKMAKLYYEQQEYDQALVYFLAAERQLTAIGNTKNLAFLYGDIGLSYQRKDQLEAALPYLNQSLEAHRQQKNQVGEAKTLEYLADLYHRQLAYDTALVLLEEARTLKAKIGYREGVGDNYLLTGEVLFTMGKIREALETFDQAEQTFRETGLKQKQMEAYLLKIGAYSGTDQYRTAFDYYQKYNALKDTVLEEERDRRFEILESQYENEKLSLKAEKQEKAIQLKNKELELQEKEQEVLRKDKELLDRKNRLLNQQAALTEQEKALLAQSLALLEKDKEILQKGYDLLESENARKQAEAEVAWLEAERQSEIVARRGVQIFALIAGLGLLALIALLLVRVSRQRKVAADRQSELNATKDKFFSLVAHDLKNPFGVLQSTSSLLAEQYDDLSDDHRKAIAENLAKTISNSYELVDNLLLWSRAQSKRVALHPASLNLAEIVAENLEVTRPMAGIRDIQLINQVPTKAKVNADRNALEVILRNLIVNAVKFSHPNGKVTISARKLQGQWEIAVQDEGIGISEADQALLFQAGEDPGTIGNHKGKGTGLGLLLCYEFVNQMGGQIQVESELGVGTTFRFSLPAA